MRRWWALAAVAVVLLALGGCGRPAGVDGDLTNAWAAFPKARTPVPVAGVCYLKEYDSTWYGDFDSATDCRLSHHQTETVYVGAFTGADADRSAPPLAGSAARRTAYGQCQKSTDDYLGGDWQSAKVLVGLVLPDDKAWTGGARWYRCDAVQYKDSDYNFVNRYGSVKDGLRGSRPLAVTCVTVTDDGKNSVTGTDDTPCDQPHNGELAGLFTAPDGAWPANENTRRDMANNGCEAVVAHFLGYPGDKAISNYLGWMAQGFIEEQWNLGDRTERCFVIAFNGKSANGARILGSVKGLRGGAPKKA